MVRLFKEKQMKWSTNAEPSAAIPGEPILFLNGDTIADCDAYIIEVDTYKPGKRKYVIYIHGKPYNKYFYNIPDAKNFAEKLVKGGL